ncbi:MAG: hypothetical protein KF846_00030 [Cyclobacteriaceae bacterium]|nr:hypothetical protein [Cyclobacteriaceae bacterium]
MNTRPYPLVRLPKKSEQVIALLREELKANFFFNRLAKAGLDDCPHQPYLGSVVLALMGFESCPDELMGFYLKRLEHHTAKLKPNKGHQHITKKALHFYSDLRQKKSG